MKPVIRFTGKWSTYCKGWGICGWGATPLQAYEDWNREVGRQIIRLQALVRGRRI